MKRCTSSVSRSGAYERNYAFSPIPCIIACHTESPRVCKGQINKWRNSEVNSNANHLYDTIQGTLLIPVFPTSLSWLCFYIGPEGYKKNTKSSKKAVLHWPSSIGAG